MASRRRTARRGGGGGGLRGFVAAGAMILLVAAAVVGWWNYNGFKNIGDAIDWFQNKSANMNQCVDDELNAGNGEVQDIVNPHGCIVPHLGSAGTSDGAKGSLDGNLNEQVTQVSLTVLDGLKVAEPQKVSYSRSEWKHWLDLDGNGCDTREDALVAAGTDVKTDPKTCKVLSGLWVENYSNKTYDNPSGMDLDHVVPLSWAAANGGNDWAPERKEQFANDPSNLFLADASENRSKGDKGLADYLPPNEAFQCTYVKTFVAVLDKYKLTIPQADKDKATFVLKNKC